MSSVTCVIGGMYGNEGKGNIVHFLTSDIKKPTAVVRFNGTANAANTVRLSNGINHAFSHFGSGTFNHCPTILSEFFVVHPLLYVKELISLQAIGVSPRVFIHPECIVATPYDMITNQLLEKRRGNNRYGSTGVGFNEAIERDASISIRFRDLYNLQNVRAKLEDIQENWVFNRVGSKQSEDENQWFDSINNDSLITDFIDCCELMIRHSSILDYNTFKEFDLVFEGSQGLLLDQTYGVYPYVTRSNTGLKNIVEILKNFIVDGMNVIHVVKSYTTRHGNGPLTFEQSLPDWVGSNQYHLYQGELRYSPLNLDDVLTAVEQDYTEIQDWTGIIKRKLAITCIDQLPDNCSIIFNNTNYNIKKSDFLDCFEQHADYLSFGPTKEDIQIC